MIVILKSKIVNNDNLQFKKQITPSSRGTADFEMGANFKCIIIFRYIQEKYSNMVARNCSIFQFCN